MNLYGQLFLSDDWGEEHPAADFREEGVVDLEEVGGWVGGWVEESDAVRMRYCELGVWVGGWGWWVGGMYGPRGGKPCAPRFCLGRISSYCTWWCSSAVARGALALFLPRLARVGLGWRRRQHWGLWVEEVAVQVLELVLLLRRRQGDPWQFSW